MSSNAPREIVKGHHHLATPELDRGKAELEAFTAAVPQRRATSRSGFSNKKTSTIIIGIGLHIFSPDLGFKQVGACWGSLTNYSWTRIGVSSLP